MDAKSDLTKSARQAKSIVKTNTKSMSALLLQRVFRTKIGENSHVFFGIQFGRHLGKILGWFWEAKNFDFHIFFDDFSKQILNSVLEASKYEKNRLQDDEAVISGPARRNVRGPGER